jgi:glycosyltransferase involved in cell wall biosynthesis
MNKISVVICTRNRAALLAQTLAALGNVTIPPGTSVEIVVVNNGAEEDGTAAVVREAKFSEAELRYIFEPQPGQVRARNRGLAEAAGDLIVFTDDDVAPAEDWLVRLSAPILANTADAVAGRVRIAPSRERPWMTVFHRSWVACTAALDPLNPGRMVGANMAFARSILEKVPAFDEELGPGALGFGDDTLFSQQIKEAGYRIAFAFDAVVEHRFTEDRLEARQWKRSAKALGQVDAYISHHWEHAVWRHPHWALCKGYLQLLRNRIFAFTRRPKSPAPEPYLSALRHFHALLYYVRERKRPRNYERHGLVKLRRATASP